MIFGIQSHIVTDYISIYICMYCTKQQQLNTHTITDTHRPHHQLSLGWLVKRICVFACACVDLPYTPSDIYVYEWYICMQNLKEHTYNENIYYTRNKHTRNTRAAKTHKKLVRVCVCWSNMKTLVCGCVFWYMQSETVLDRKGNTNVGGRPRFTHINIPSLCPVASARFDSISLSPRKVTFFYPIFTLTLCTAVSMHDVNRFDIRVEYR